MRASAHDSPGKQRGNDWVGRPKCARLTGLPIVDTLVDVSEPSSTASLCRRAAEGLGEHAWLIPQLSVREENLGGKLCPP